MNTFSKIAVLAFSTTFAAAGCAAPPVLDDVDETSGASTSGERTERTATRACESAELALPATLERMAPGNRKVSAELCPTSGEAMRVTVKNIAKTQHDAILSVFLRSSESAMSRAKITVVGSAGLETQLLRNEVHETGSLGIGDNDTVSGVTLSVIIRHLEAAKGPLELDVHLPSGVKAEKASVYLGAVGMKGGACAPNKNAKDLSRPTLIADFGYCYGGARCACTEEEEGCDLFCVE